MQWILSDHLNLLENMDIYCSYICNSLNIASSQMKGMALSEIIYKMPKNVKKNTFLSWCYSIDSWLDSEFMIHHKCEEQMKTFPFIFWINKFVYFLYNNFIIKNGCNKGICLKFPFQHVMCCILESIPNVQSNLYHYV